MAWWWRCDWFSDGGVNRWWRYEWLGGGGVNGLVVEV